MRSLLHYTKDVHTLKEREREKLSNSSSLPLVSISRAFLLVAYRNPSKAIGTPTFSPTPLITVIVIYTMFSFFGLEAVTDVYCLSSTFKRTINSKWNEKMAAQLLVLANSFFIWFDVCIYTRNKKTSLPSRKRERRKFIALRMMLSESLNIWHQA